MDTAAKPVDRRRLAKPARKGLLSPTNIRRWKNFKANRRGYWSLWLFLVLFGLSLFAEFIANDRPIIVSYKGEMAVSRAGELSRGEVRRLPGRDGLPRPVISDEINANGWMIWPPIRYSYAPIPTSRIRRRPPILDDEQGRALLRSSAGRERSRAAASQWNWLGTDDQARDVVAR
jgi:microcin C transport system permease protein